MMFRTHILFALLFYILVLKVFSIGFLPVFALVLCFGSILPDIDSPSSFVNKKYLLGIGNAVSAFSTHRGFFHSIFGALLFMIICFLLGLWLKFSAIYILALGAGYILHLAADSFNVSGIKWFWKSGHVKWIVRTGSISENIFFVVICAALVLLVWHDVGAGISTFFAG
jgi:inner membrane protein